MASTWVLVLISLLLVGAASSDHHPKYQALPPLKEQAALQDAWTKERISHIPQLLQKYEIGAWLVGEFKYIITSSIDHRHR